MAEPFHGFLSREALHPVSVSETSDGVLLEDELAWVLASDFSAQSPVNIESGLGGHHVQHLGW